MLRHILLAALLGTATEAQPAPAVGMVEQPCEGLTPQIPDAVKTYIREISALSQTATIPPAPPELAAYRAENLEARKSDWGDLCRYRADNERLRDGPASARQIVFMGDSITQNWTINDPAFFTAGVVNRGISGQTTPQMLLRFQSDVIALKPRAVHIMAGTNDIAGNTGPNSPETYQANIRAMVTLSKAAGIDVILASIPPTSGFAWKPGLKPAPRIAELNAWLRSYAEAEDLIFVDYYAALTTPDGALRPELTFDGVHPNDAGYKAMAPLAHAALGAIGTQKLP